LKPQIRKTVLQLERPESKTYPVALKSDRFVQVPRQWVRAVTYFGGHNWMSIQLYNVLLAHVQVRLEKNPGAFGDWYEANIRELALFLSPNSQKVKDRYSYNAINGAFERLMRKGIIRIEVLDLKTGRVKMRELHILDAWETDTSKSGWWRFRFGRTFGEMYSRGLLRGWGKFEQKDLLKLKSVPDIKVYEICSSTVGKGLSQPSARYVSYMGIRRYLGWNGVRHREPRWIRYDFKKHQQSVKELTGRDWYIEDFGPNGIVVNERRKRKQRKVAESAPSKPKLLRQPKLSLDPDDLDVKVYFWPDDDPEFEPKRLVGWKPFYPYGEWQFTQYRNIGRNPKPFAYPDKEGHPPNFAIRACTPQEEQDDRDRQLARQKKTKGKMRMPAPVVETVKLLDKPKSEEPTRNWREEVEKRIQAEKDSIPKRPMGELEKRFRSQGWTDEHFRKAGADYTPTTPEKNA